MMISIVLSALAFRGNDVSTFFIITESPLLDLTNTLYISYFLLSISFYYYFTRLDEM